MIDLEFVKVETPTAGSLAVSVGDVASRTGIYWLTFDDGTEYVGQAVEVVRRLATHRRHQAGRITTVSFAPVPPGELDRAERWWIEQRDLAGAHLRNTLITRTPGGPGLGCVAVRPGVTIALPWERELRGHVPADHRPGRPETSERQARQWAQLRAHPTWPAIRGFLRRIVRETMSSPHLTAGRLWTVSAMPRTTPLPGWRRLCTMNVGRIEAIYVGEDVDAGVVLHWNVAVPDEREERELRDEVAGSKAGGYIDIEVHGHYSDPTTTLTLSNVDLAESLLALPTLRDLAYRYNTRYQRQGVALQRRGHNPLLAAGLLTSNGSVDRGADDRTGMWLADTYTVTQGPGTWSQTVFRGRSAIPRPAGALVDRDARQPGPRRRRPAKLL